MGHSRVTRGRAGGTCRPPGGDPPRTDASKGAISVAFLGAPAGTLVLAGLAESGGTRAAKARGRTKTSEDDNHENDESMGCGDRSCGPGAACASRAGRPAPPHLLRGRPDDGGRADH